MTNDIERLTPCLKSLQRNMLQPEMGQHMEYAGKITQKMQVTKERLHYMHIWLVEALRLEFLRKANFSLQQRNKFLFTTKLKIPLLRRFLQLKSQNSQVISNPMISLNKVMRSTNNSLPDTQVIHNRGHG